MKTSVLLCCLFAGALSATIPNNGDCNCAPELNPIRGTDGLTYDNICEFNCAKTIRPYLNVSFHLTCKEVSNDIKPQDFDCTINADYDPVCGSDGRTYFNPCEFEYVKNFKPEITILGHYKCEDVHAVIDPSRDSFDCTYQYTPVRGSDGRIYDNICEFNCAQKKSPSLTIVSHYKCEDLPHKFDPYVPVLGPLGNCICTYKLEPVCGSDGRTYISLCFFRCDQLRKPSLTVVANDACPGFHYGDKIY